MKQILQNLSNGRTELVEAPVRNVRARHVLVDTSVSPICIGTERMLVDFGKWGFISKARLKPEKVSWVIDKVQTDGLLTMIDAVRSKLEQPIPLRFCHVGLALEYGANTYNLGQGAVRFRLARPLVAVSVWRASSSRHQQSPMISFIGRQAFVANVVGSDHICATQFHPEKSNEWGAALLHNFAEQLC